MCGLVKRSSLLYLISSEKGTCTWHLQLSETENGAWSKAGGLPFQDLGTGKCVALFSGLVGPKYHSSPASFPTHRGGFRTPNLQRLQGLSLLLGILVFPRLPPVYRKSLRTDWRLPGCFFPPACFLCRSYSESLGLGCCWGTHRQVFLDGNQCLFSVCSQTAREPLGGTGGGVGRKKNPNTGGGGGQNKNLSHLTILQTGLPRISPVKHILRIKCHLP